MPSTRRPNVLWLMADEQRCDSLGCYGSPWAATPHLDALAAEGAVFTHAVTPAPVCVPARLSLVSALHPCHTGVWWNYRHTATPPFLTTPFARAGYAVASFGKQDDQSPVRPWPLEQSIVLSDAVHYYRYREGYDAAGYGVVQYPPAPYPWIFGGTFPEDASQTAEARCVREAQAWLEGLPAGQPFFLRLSFNAPHTPVAPPAPYDHLVDPGAVTLPEGAEGPAPDRPRWVDDLATAADAARLTPEEIRAMRGYYYGQVAFVDAQFGALLGWMRERGLLEDTIVAFTSDHGTHLGDYGLVQKQTFYEPVVNVPLLLWYPPAIASGGAYDTPVEAISLLPTLLDLAGLDAVACDAPSLAEGLRRGEEPAARPVYSEFTLGSFEMRPDDRLVMVREGSLKLSCCLDPQVHDVALHDLEKDPYERHNVYGQAEYATAGERLLGLVREHLLGAAPVSAPRPR